VAGVAAEHGDAVYSLGLLRDVAGWSVPVALIAALLGSALTRDPRFGVSCVIGAAADVGTLVWALRRTRGMDPAEALASGPLAGAFVVRITAKAVLLVAAALLPAWLDLWGMVVGVLVVDLTLATVGSVAVAWHTFHPSGSGG
jgi:hypothetical protein